MPKPKRSTDFMTGDNSILFPFIYKYFERNPPPPSWGDEKDQWLRARFLARAAANPDYLDCPDQEVPLDEIQYLHDYFAHAFQEDPDYFLAFLAYIRSCLNPRTYSAMAKTFLRQGAMKRFKDSKGREPTDGELSMMIQKKHGVSVSEEYFGDARRMAKAEDEKVLPKLRRMRGA